MTDQQTRTNGVTIMFGGQIMVTQTPIEKDNIFLNQAVYWSCEFQKTQPKPKE